MTTLMTEAVKKWLDDLEFSYKPNILAGIQAIIVSVIVGTCWKVITGTKITPELIAWAVILIILSWLCAMVGYDKVKQTLLQIKDPSKKEDGSV